MHFAGTERSTIGSRESGIVLDMYRGHWEGGTTRREERNMARIIVTPDHRSDVVLLDERIHPVHLENKVSSLQVIERLAWAVQDADAAVLDDEAREVPDRVGV